jgi:hypothetical protein
MCILLYLLLAGVTTGNSKPQQSTETAIVYELFRLRNQHKADSAEHFFADTVQVYMKYLKNVPKNMITRSDKNFWKAHPNNKFEMTAPVEIITRNGSTIAIVFGKEYLDGSAFQYERIEIKFDRDKKIYSFRGIKLKKG